MAARYIDVVTDRRGNAVPGASVLVKTAAGASATIYSDANLTTTIANPLTTNADGEYSFFAANGQYTFEVTAAGYATEIVSNRPHFDPTGSAPVQLACSDRTTDITVTSNAAYCRAPKAFTLSEVAGSLFAASSSGLPQFDVKKNGVSIFSTKPTFDVGEKTTATAATPAVLVSTPTRFAKDDEIVVDITATGPGAKWLVVQLLEA